MLSRDCDGCGQMELCKIRFKSAKKNDKVSCPDGTAHLIDSEEVDQFKKSLRSILEVI